MSKAFFSESGKAVFGAFSDDCPCVCQCDGTFYTTWQTATANETITLPLVYGLNYNATINWGDGTPDSTVTSWNDVNKTHLYLSAGLHTVTISGLFEAWSMPYSSDADKLISINFNSKNFKYLYRGFYNCVNLETVEGSIGDCGLEYHYKGLEECFAWCTSLKTVSEELFANCSTIENFKWCFIRCYSLEYIPENLFSNCIAATVFSGCFALCTSLTGNSGGLWQNPSGSPLYTLAPSDYDNGIPDGQNCYEDCTGLSDYATMPTYWK